MTKRTLGLAIVVVLLGAAAAQAQPYAYVIGSGAWRAGVYYTTVPNRLITIDTAAGQAIASLTLGCITPTGVAVTSDGTRVLVTCGSATSTSGSLLAIDPVAKQIVGTRTFTRSVEGVAVIPGTTRALIEVGLPNLDMSPEAQIVDITTLATVGTISLAGNVGPLFGHGIPIEVSADGSRAYLGFHTRLQGTVTVLNLTSMSVVTAVTSGLSTIANDLSLSGDGSELGILNLDTTALMNTSTSALSALTSGGSRGIVMNATGDRAFLSQSATSLSLDVRDTSGALLQSFNAPGAGLMTGNAARDRVYIAANSSAPEQLVVMNPATGAVISGAIARGLISKPAVPATSAVIAADACTYSLAFKSGLGISTTPTTSPVGTTGRIDVIALPDRCTWTTRSSAPWITFEFAGGTGPDNVGFTVAPNTSGVTRTGTITIGGQTLTISQAGCTNPIIYIERPTSGAAVTQPVKVSGWAIDTCAPTGTGIGISSTDIGYGAGRPDVAAAFGSSQFTNSGFSFNSVESAAGLQTITVDVRDTVTNQVVTASVTNVNVLPSAAPFGVIDTPVAGATVSGDMPLTGWVLDDVGILGNVLIYRNALAGETPTPNAGNRVFVGVVTRVTGARPDVQAAYPNYPDNDRAGFGAMILTNALPNGGNGAFTFTVDAADRVHAQATIASRTVTVDNASSPLPFGAIDFPGPGATVSGQYAVQGWVLTPQPAAIPTDGSTVSIVVDGVVVGHPSSISVPRPDVQALFPTLANSATCGFAFTLDTTTLANGLHTIALVVEDSAGHAKGIGSRYFTVQNP